ncbi:MAG: tRNA(fMet)-specific endonuclease VapC [Candidatus Kentron sp. G]|nr:MAG: tRNA(fMet)-specific endonuclease VapC [Candidatus Kentron sp. G]
MDGPSAKMLDTNMVSYALKGTWPAVRNNLMRHAPSELCISAITKSELVYGLARKPHATRLAHLIGELLHWIEVKDWNAQVATVHGQLRATLDARGVVLGSFDLMIAAHALALDMPLITHDRAFARVDGLVLEDWTLDELTH